MVVSAVENNTATIEGPRVSGPRGKLSRDAFERFVQGGEGIGRAPDIHVAQPFEILPCSCADASCLGWRVVSVPAISLVDELLAALKSAVETIRVWHGMNEPDDMAPAMWQLYQQSPEMRRINAAIENAERRS